jgi:peptidoglycan/LPS O-acetylase OafA/YrhL
MRPAPDGRPGPAGADHLLPYVPALDGIRALAVAGVLLYHAGVAWLPGGFLGVDVFFVLSGFLITSLLLAERGATGRIDLPRFWIRRARRLLPAAFLVIGVSVIAAALLAPGDLARTRADALASLVYANNWHQLLGDHSYFAAFERPSLLLHLWSLAVEEQFYLLWPLALGACLSRIGRRGAAWVTLAAALASAVLMATLFEPGGDPSRVHFGTDTHASGLLAGALLAFARPLGRLRLPRRRSALVVVDAGGIVALAVLLLAMTGWTDYDAGVYRGGLALIAVAATVLIVAAVHPASRVARALAAAPLVWIGVRSYGIYLWHWPVIALTRPGVDVHGPRPVIVLGQVALTVTLAAASYRWVERPLRTGAGQRALRGWLDRRPPRRRLAIVGSTLAVALACLAWVGLSDPRVVRATPVLERASTVAEQAPERAAASDRRRQGRPLAVGASVMLAARPELERRVVVDAAIGRQLPDILARLRRYRVAGTLPDRVVVQIGENGPVTRADIEGLRRTLRDVRRVVLVNVRVPRNWDGAVNAALADAVADWPAARLADWYAASARAGLLYPDGTHPTRAGQRVYARLVERALR